MARTSRAGRLAAPATVALAVVTAVGCSGRERLVAWRPVDVMAPAGEPGGRGARTYRVALPAAGEGERAMRAELLFANAIDGAHVDAVGVDGRARRPLLSRTPA